MAERYELFSDETGAQLARISGEFREALRMANQLSGISRRPLLECTPIRVLDSRGQEVYRTNSIL